MVIHLQISFCSNDFESLTSDTISFRFSSFNTDFDNKQQAKIVAVIWKYERVVFVCMYIQINGMMTCLFYKMVLCQEEIITEHLVRRMVIMFGLPLEDWAIKAYFTS